MKRAKKKDGRSNQPAGSRMLRAVRAHFPLVSGVKDARDDVVIEVTQADINWASKKNHSHCAMARACERAAGVDAAIISTHIAFLIHGDTAIRYRVPEQTRREIVTFDRGGEFMPGEYLLAAPNKNMLIGVKRSTIFHGKKKQRRKQRHIITQGIRRALTGSPK